MNSIELTLRHYRRFHAPSVFKLHPGLTVISGENGAGKSTLGQAMLHALFAATPKPDPRSDGASEPYHLHLKMRGPDTDLEVTVENGRYQVQIDGRPHLQGRTGTQRAAQAVISDYLGLLDQRAFERVYFALQNDTAAFVGMKPKDRRDLIEDVLQLRTVNLAVELQGKRVQEQRDEVLTRLSAAADAVSALRPSGPCQDSIKAFRQATSVRSKRGALAAFGAELAQAVTAQEVCVADCRQSLEALEAQRRAAGEATKARLDSLHAAETYCQAFVAAHTQREEASRELAAAQAVVKTRVQTLGERHRDVEAARAAEPQALQHEAESNRLQDLRRQLEVHQQSAPLASAWISAQKRQDDLERRLRPYASLEQELQLHQTALVDCEGHAAAYAADPYAEILLAQKATLPLHTRELKDLTELLKQLTDRQGTRSCPTCGAPMTADQQRARQEDVRDRLSRAQAARQHAVSRVADTEAQQRTWSGERLEAQQALERVRTTCHEDQTRLAARALLEAQLADARRDAAQALAECQEAGVTLPVDPAVAKRLQTDISASTKRLAQLDAAKTTFMQLETRAQALRAEEERLLSAKQALHICHEEWASIAYEPDAHERAKSAASAAREAHSAARVSEAEAGHGVQQATARWKEAQDCESKLRGHQADIAQEVLGLEQEDRLAEHLNGFQNHFFSVNVKAVMQRASQLIAPATKNAIRALELDPDATLHYWDQFKQRHDAKRLSGGEQAIVGLCIRLALAERAQAILKGSRVKFLILDEVLGSLDEVRRSAVQGILADILDQRAFEYIIMITHLDEVKNNWDAHRMEVRLDRTSGMSSIALLESTWSS